MNAFIYNKKCELIAKPIVTCFEDFKSEPTKFFPNWNSELIASDIEFQNPLLDNGIIRDKTREEQILLDNRLELLLDGEVVNRGCN